MPPTEVSAVTEPQAEGLSQSAPLSQQTPPKRSWVNVAKPEQKSLTKYDVEVTLTDGVGTVEVPEEVFSNPSPLWEDFLIGRFLEKAPHIGKIHAIVNKIWTTGDKSQMIEVYQMNDTTMKFRITNSAMRARVLRRGMWNLAAVPVVKSEWKPFVEEEKTEDSVPLWVQLTNVPMNMFSWKGLSFIASPVGVPVRLHPDTALCKDFKVAKVFVKADLTKELPRSMNFKFQGKDTLVDFTYPWLPSKCSVCGKWGHLEKVCTSRLKAMSQVSQDDEPAKRAEATLVTDAEEVMNQNTVGKEGMSKENKSGKSSLNETEWETPTKVGRSQSPSKQKKLDFGEVSILSNSRFALLSSEEGELISQDEAIPTNVEVTEPTAERDGSRATEEALVTSQDVCTHNKVIGTRPSLPRVSKDNHKLVSHPSIHQTNDSSQSLLNKKVPKKNT
ncbi:hypothetical protein N665_2441s0006 [Sinapis alba]|nr:hypothetical protein N665_2441s0006 [Sinapis alba]